MVNVEVREPHGKIKVYDVVGKMIGQFDNDGQAGTVVINLSDAAPGIYILKMEVDGKEWSGKVVLEE